MADVHVTEPIHPDALALLASAGLSVSCGWKDADPAAGLATARAWILRTFVVSPEMIAGAPGLEAICKHGVGTDNIPLAEAERRGIPVFNTPGANANAVAEHTMMMLLALTRQAVAMDRVARAGFAGFEQLAPLELSGLRMLILGFGPIGQRVGQLARAFDIEVTLWHRRLSAEEAGVPVVRDLAAALPAAQILTLHLPLNAGTRGLIGAAELAALPEGAILLNTGRGGIVDEAALVAAAPRLGGIGLDVFETEPPPPSDPLLALPNALLSPHAAALGERSVRRMGMMAAEAAIRALGA
ncbi:NAD(P)-dependent oxidoreductase [Rhodovulum sulfidophilum]|uniref:NAD(P)-dependent oxidoreductase n=1 Tax=Rhodovulum sulfidophilum TaxID=35806 RepID=UPI00138A14F2|nr:NAD(P)-dependent oxidoreductase [Rhodovulum sulfidophilum]NDK34040.1 hydroxyacid dehydrogenase [Rhodovulum sulfidophilum]